MTSGKQSLSDKVSLLHDDGPPSDVFALLGKPEQIPGHTDYYCPYQIQGVGSDTVRYTSGIDTCHALHLAIRSLGGDLEVLNRRLEGKLR